jgi:asparagine synthase (glutamine-hydrolysing)
MRFILKKGIKLLDKLIWHLETYDVINRASVPMYFLSKAISDLGIKVVLEEQMRFLRYLYFRNAPSAEFRKNRKSSKLLPIC